MDNLSIEKQLEEMFSKEEFVVALMEAEDAKAFSEVLASNGVVLEEGLSAEEAFKVFKEHVPSDELNEDSLEDVAGGGLGLSSLAILAKGGTLLTLSTGTVVCAGVVFLGAAAVCGYVAYQRMKRK